MDKANIEVIEKLPPSTSVKAIRRFLWHIKFYMRLLRILSKIAWLLMKLLKKDAPLNFGNKCVEAFIFIMERLINT